MLKVAVMGVNYAHSLKTLNEIVENDREEKVLRTMPGAVIMQDGTEYRAINPYRNNQDQYDQLILGGGRRLWKGFMPMVILFRNNYLASSCVPDPIQYLE